MKKIASLLITGAMLASILPVMNVSAYSGGSGTQADPYLIGSKSDWTQFRNYINSDDAKGAGKYWKLTADLDFTISEGKKDWVVPIAQYDTGRNSDNPDEYEAPEGTAFKGNLNGNGHIIKNYEINATNTGYGTHGAFGLFSAIGGNAVIENLGIEDVSLRMGAADIYISAGALTGAMIDNAEIRNCYSKNVSCKHDYPAGTYSNTGGLAGSMYGTAKIFNCYSLSFSESTNEDKRMYHGGIVGGIYSKDTSIQKCYSDTTIGVADAGKWGNWWHLYYPNTTELKWPGAYYSQGTHVGYIGVDDTLPVDELKAVPNNLKSAFAADTKNINGGYPILRWQVGTHDSSYFKFTVNAEKETIYSKASINVTADGVNKTSAPVDITEIKLDPDAGVDFYVNITNVPDTVKVNSITLE